MELRYFQTISVWLNCCRSFDNLQNKKNKCFTNFSFINFTAYIHVTYKKVCISWTFVVILKITNQCCSYIYNIKLFFSFWMSHEGTYEFFKKAEVVCLIECATRVFFFSFKIQNPRIKRFSIWYNLQSDKTNYYSVTADYTNRYNNFIFPIYENSHTPSGFLSLGWRTKVKFT